MDAQHLARVGLLVQLAEEIARERADGHLTLLPFTTGWKVPLGTPGLDSGAGRHEVAALQAYPTLEAALEAFVATAPAIPEVDVAAIHARWRAEEHAWWDTRPDARGLNKRRVAGG